MEKAAGYVSAVLQTQRVTELAFISLNVWFLLVKFFFDWLFYRFLTPGATQNVEQISMALSRYFKKQYLLSLR